MELKAWPEVVRLHSDVESESTAIATYAIDLGALVMKDPNVPPTYRDAYSFFRATHLTSGLRRLITEVYERLSGKEGDRVLQMRSPFGGGKSHLLASLFYAIRERGEMEKVVPEMKGLPTLSNVRVAVFDGEKFDALSGKEVEGQRIRTMWGWLAWQLNEYELVKEHDQKRIPPSGDLIKAILDGKPTLILLDEVSRYLERAMGERVGDSTLYRLALEFMQTLTTEVSGSKQACLIYSLQASAREFYGDAEILSTLDHLASRVDAKREPIVGDEIFSVLRKRLLAEAPSDEIANKVADIYVDLIKRNILTYVRSEAERRDLEERIIKYRERFVRAYPFHPALIDLMRERWASIPEFQRTRGVLRFLAVVMRTLKNRNVRDYLISATDIPIEDPDVKNAFFTEVGQREPYQAVLESDFIGPNATIRKIDRILDDAQKPATQTATAILMYSFGGQPRIEGKEGETLPPGVIEHDLMVTTIKPSLDSTMVRAVLKELVGACQYIHFDGVKYAFKTIPNVNKVLEDEATKIGTEEVDKKIKNRLEKELGGKSAIIWPFQSREIPDKEPTFCIAYLPFEFVFKKDQEKWALDYLTQYGDKPRVYKNAIGVAPPDANHIEPLRRALKYLTAVERVKGKKTALNLQAVQLEQLKEREKTENAAMESSLRTLYNSVWLPKIEEGSVTIESLDIGGRALQATTIHDRLMELLHVSPPKVFDTLQASKIVELMRIQEGTEAKNVVETFFSSPGFPRLINDSIIRKAIARGVNDKLFGITSKEKVQRLDGAIKVAREHVIIGKEVSEDEIDLSSGFIVMPQVIPPEEVEKEEEKEREREKEVEKGKQEKEEAEKKEEKEVKEGKMHHLFYKMKVTRLQLFKCFDALGNLAEKSGEISLSVEAKSEEGLDKNWVRNAIEEPIEEAGVVIKKEEEEEK